MEEDHVSMGWGAALKLRAVLDNLRHILAVELVSAARAQDLRQPLKAAPATAAVRDLLRKRAPAVGANLFSAPVLPAAGELSRAVAVVPSAAAVAAPPA